MTDQNLSKPQIKGKSTDEKKNFLINELSTKFIQGGGVHYCWVLPVTE